MTVLRARELAPIYELVCQAVIACFAETLLTRPRTTQVGGPFISRATMGGSSSRITSNPRDFATVMPTQGGGSDDQKIQSYDYIIVGGGQLHKCTVKCVVTVV